MPVVITLAAGLLVLPGILLSTCSTPQRMPERPKFDAPIEVRDELPRVQPTMRVRVQRVEAGRSVTIMAPGSVLNVGAPDGTQADSATATREIRVSRRGGAWQFDPVRALPAALRRASVLLHQFDWRRQDSCLRYYLGFLVLLDFFRRRATSLRRSGV